MYICKNLDGSALFCCKYHIGLRVLPVIVINRSETKCDYIKGNISDVDDNAYYEAEGTFVCIYVEIRTNLR